MINMGGGFPANYITRTNELGVYAEEIARFLHDFVTTCPRSSLSRAGR